jgi:hypothetical protein
MCSFCGVAVTEVEKLIAGPGVYICDKCIRVSAAILRRDLPPSPPGEFVIAGTPVSCSHCKGREFCVASSPFIANFAPHTPTDQDGMSLLSCLACGHVEIFTGQHRANKPAA